MSKKGMPKAEFLLIVAPGVFVAWVDFSFPGKVPNGFAGWCQTQPGVKTVEGPAPTRPRNKITLWMDEFSTTKELRQRIFQIIAAASTYCGHVFAINDQGVHAPQPDWRSDDRHIGLDLHYWSKADIVYTGADPKRPELRSWPYRVYLTLTYPFRLLYQKCRR